MKVVHFVYPYGPQTSTPHAIGREVALRLRQKYEVVQYEWDEAGKIVPSADEVLVGHAHPYPWTIMRRSMQEKGWERIILLEPYCHGIDWQYAFIDQCIHRADLFLAITGNYWFESIPQSPVAHWLPKAVHVDLAVNRNDFPSLKERFNPPGKRRFLYIGHSGQYKNVSWLNEIAKALPEYEFSWIGAGDPRYDGLSQLGYQNFRTDVGRQLIAQHDFLLTVGNADANPTTILEAMAWGLIPVCTMESGYRGYPGIINVPLNHTNDTVQILRELQSLPEERLLHLQNANYKLLDEHFNWDRFSQQVIDAIESDASPALGYESLATKTKLRFADMNSPFYRQFTQSTFRKMKHKIAGNNNSLVAWAKRATGYGNQK